MEIHKREIKIKSIKTGIKFFFTGGIILSYILNQTLIHNILICFLINVIISYGIYKVAKYENTNNLHYELRKIAEEQNTIEQYKNQINKK